MATHDEADPFAAAFGQAVRSLRENLDLSQEELCFRSDLDRTYISGIERGVRNPTLRTIRRLADALDTKPSRLLTLTERALAK